MGKTWLDKKWANVLCKQNSEQEFWIYRSN